MNCCQRVFYLLTIHIVLAAISNFYQQRFQELKTLILYLHLSDTLRRQWYNECTSVAEVAFSMLTPVNRTMTENQISHI